MLSLLAAAAVGAGCSDTHGRLPVRGTVTLNGEPLADGTVRFVSEPGTPHCEEGAMVEGGGFAIAAKDGLRPGKYRVIVSAPDPKSVSGDAGAPSGMARELLPARYNTATTLTAEVAADRDNTFTYELTR